jgi:hypothetical protein
MKNLTAIAFVLVLAGTGFGQDCDPVKFFEGLWKVDGKEQFESWKPAADGALAGEGYRIRNGARVVTETLEMKKVDGVLSYLATVPGQNDGRAVAFRMTSCGDSGFVFENPAHDFPQKLIYRSTGKGKMEAEVLGGDGRGFKLAFSRQ